MRISDWSSDVCSSDLPQAPFRLAVMTPTVGRLKTRPQFLKVAAAKRKWVTPGLVLQAVRRPQGEDRATSDARMTPAEPPPAHEAGVRAGFTVPRKGGKAVERNRSTQLRHRAAAEGIPRPDPAGTDHVDTGPGRHACRQF